MTTQINATNVNEAELFSFISGELNGKYRHDDKVYVIDGGYEVVDFQGESDGEYLGTMEELAEAEGVEF